MGQLDNQTAVITGGGSGIGFTLAELFHREGARIELGSLVSPVKGGLSGKSFL